MIISDIQYCSLRILKKVKIINLNGLIYCNLDNSCTYKIKSDTKVQWVWICNNTNNRIIKRIYYDTK